jgi:hypothetical protein
MSDHHITAGRHSASHTPPYAYPIGVGDSAWPPVRTTQSNRQLSKRFQARPSLTARTAAGGPVVDSSDEKSGFTGNPSYSTPSYSGVPQEQGERQRDGAVCPWRRMTSRGLILDQWVRRSGG